MIRSTMMMVAAGASLALAGCSGGGGDTLEGASSGALLRQAVAQTVAARRGAAAAPAQAPLPPEEIAARALASNPAPLILAGVESTGSTQAMAMVGDNGGMRTYMTPNEQALILRGGMLVGTRGLGNDLSVAEVSGVEGLIRARRAGQGSRTMRYITGEGVERPLPLSCSVQPGAAQVVPLAGGGSVSARQVVESCQGSGATVQNNYLVTEGGSIPVSRQWIGPALGHVTIQTIRP